MQNVFGFWKMDGSNLEIIQVLKSGHADHSVQVSVRGIYSVFHLAFTFRYIGTGAVDDVNDGNCLRELLKKGQNQYWNELLGATR